MRILLAEDNEINQQLGVRLLQRQGHEVTLARDGEEAVRLAIASPNGFDLILMDLQMPLLDGAEATAAIRRHEAECGGHVPILALTAHYGPDRLQSCLDAGMDGGVTKPLDMAQIEAAVASARRGTPTRVPEAETIRWGAALDLVLGDEELLREMSRLFLQQAAGMVADVADAHHRGEAGTLQRAAHRLKGSLGNFGAADTAALAGRLEDVADSGELAAGVPLLAPLRAAVAEVCRELEERLQESDA